MEHRWSGWPGAWCLDCGITDPIEECIADSPHDGNYLEEYDTITGEYHDPDPLHQCPKHPITECTEPNSHSYDPYYKGVLDDQGTVVPKDGNE